MRGHLLLSLIHLQMYAVPLFAFVLSYAGVLAEREQGTLDLLLSYPIVYRDLILGKWLGFCSILGFAIVAGIAAAAAPVVSGGIPAAGADRAFRCSRFCWVSAAFRSVWRSRASCVIANRRDRGVRGALGVLRLRF